MRCETAVVVVVTIKLVFVTADKWENAKKKKNTKNPEVLRPDIIQ